MSFPGMRNVGCTLRIFSSSDIWVEPGFMERALSATDGSLTFTRPHMHPENNAKTPTMQIMPNLQNIFFICAISTRFLCLKSTLIKCNRFHHQVQLLTVSKAAKRNKILRHGTNIIISVLVFTAFTHRRFRHDHSPIKHTSPTLEAQGLQ